MSTPDDIHRSSIEDEDGTREQQPLLSGDRTNSYQHGQNAIFEANHPLSTLVLYFMAIHFLIAFCEMVLVAPLIKLFEQSLCSSYYMLHDPTVIGPGGGIPESLCKIPEIQHPLATIRGWKSMFDTIPVLLVAIPFGRIGDHHGRRKVMVMTLLGVAGSLTEIFVVCAFPQIFPLRLVWLSSIILLFGGGLYSSAACMWAMASECIPSEKRSHAFYYIFSAFYVAELVASFIAAVTTDISPWIPCAFSMGSIMACLLLVSIMPDPRKSNHYLESLAFETSSIASEIRNTSSDTETPKNLLSLADGLYSALSNRNILLTIPVFLVGTLRYSTINVLIQYASIRFGMKISTGATFYTETAIVTIFLFLFLVPGLSGHVRTKYNIRPQVIDLYLVRMSTCLLCIGSLSIGLASSLKILPIGVMIFAAGFGSRVSALSLVSYWISDSSKAELYAAIAVLENIGHAIGDPSMQQILAAAMRLPPFWLGIPFLVAASLYFMAGVSAAFIKIDIETMAIIED